jgi:hypothetical protein
MDENKNSKIETTIKTMLYKQAKDKITKEEEELSYRKLNNLLEYKLKKENKPIPNGLSYATNYYYKKHKQNIRAKLRRIKQNKYITNLRAKYSDLNIDEAFQYLALDEKISMQRKGDILSIETFIQILTNRPIPKKRKKIKAEEMVTEL